MIKYHKLINKNKRLLDAIIDFNFNFASHIHPKRIKKTYNIEELKCILSCSRSCYRLSIEPAISVLFETKPKTIDDSFFFSFEEIRHRLALLSWCHLEKLLIYLGLTVHDEAVRKLVMMEDVNALSTAVGEKAYRYTLQNNLNLTGYVFQTKAEQTDSKDILQNIYTTGRSVLAIYWENIPHDLAKRLSLKFSPEFDPFSIKSTLAVNCRRSNLERLVKYLVTHEVALNWQWIFNK